MPPPPINVLGVGISAMNLPQALAESKGGSNGYDVSRGHTRRPPRMAWGKR